MSYYFENNLQNTSNQNFGSSHINLQDYYVCREKWEIVIQDGAGVQLMKATNCDDSQMNCNEIFVPDYTPTTTRNPTVIPTTTRRPSVVAPTTSPPAARTRVFLVDMENYLGPMSTDYVFSQSNFNSNPLYQYRHNVQFANSLNLNTYNALYNNRRNGSIGDNGGTAAFYWGDPFTGLNGAVEVNPVVRFGFAAPGVYNNRGAWLNDPNAPQVTGGVGTVNFSLKIYLEVGTFTNYLVSTTWHSPNDINQTPVYFSSANLFDVPPIIYDDNGNPASGRIRLELETDLGKDTIYTPWYNHPEYIGCPSLASNARGTRCNYRLES